MDSLAVAHASPRSKDGSFGSGAGLLWKQLHLNGNVSLDPGNVTLLQRVDRLDNILAVMEDKVPGEQSSCGSSSPRVSGQLPQCCWSGPPTPSSLEKRCKAAGAVLEEVEEKGTLVERVSDLEKRLCKLQQMMSTKSASGGDVHAIDATAEENDEEDHQKSIERVDDGRCEVLAIVTTITEHRATRSEEGLNYSIGREQAMMSDGAVSEHEQKMTPRQRLKTRSKRLKKWISKRLHLSHPNAAAPPPPAQEVEQEEAH